MNDKEIIKETMELLSSDKKILNEDLVGRDKLDMSFSMLSDEMRVNIDGVIEMEQKQPSTDAILELAKEYGSKKEVDTDKLNEMKEIDEKIKSDIEEELEKYNKIFKAMILSYLAAKNNEHEKLVNEKLEEIKRQHSEDE